MVEMKAIVWATDELPWSGRRLVTVQPQGKRYVRVRPAADPNTHGKRISRQTYQSILVEEVK